MNNLNFEIQNQIDYLTIEHQRAKQFVNACGFDCTTAPWVLVSNYRRAIKDHIKVLRDNLDTPVES